MVWLITRGTDRQRRPTQLNSAPMKEAIAWLEEFKRFWSSSFDQLDGLHEQLKTADR
jgi:hypothetical protein